MGVKRKRTHIGQRSLLIERDCFVRRILVMPPRAVWHEKQGVVDHEIRREYIQTLQ